MVSGDLSKLGGIQYTSTRLRLEKENRVGIYKG